MQPRINQRVYEYLDKWYERLYERKILPDMIYLLDK